MMEYAWNHVEQILMMVYGICLEVEFSQDLGGSLCPAHVPFDHVPKLIVMQKHISMLLPSTS